MRRLRNLRKLPLSLCDRHGRDLARLKWLGSSGECFLILRRPRREWLCSQDSDAGLAAPNCAQL